MGRSRNRANQRACRPRSPGCAPRSPQRPPPAAPVDHGTDPLKLWRVGGKPLPGDCSGRGPPPTRRRRPRSTPRQLLALDMQPPRGAATQQGLCSKRAAAEDRPPAGEVRQPSAQAWWPLEPSTRALPSAKPRAAISSGRPCQRARPHRAHGRAVTPRPSAHTRHARNG